MSPRKIEKTDKPDRRRTILMSALHCFNESGIEATSIDDIGRHSGASVGSIYHHFSNKEGIAIALLAEGLLANSRQLEQRLSAVKTAAQGVKTMVSSLIEWVSANPEWARYIYTVSSSRLMQMEHPLLRDANDFHTRMVNAYFEPHFKAGAFRRLPQECLPSLILGPVHDYARRWLNGQVSGPIADHTSLFANAAWGLVRKS